MLNGAELQETEDNLTRKYVYAAPNDPAERSTSYRIGQLELSKAIQQFQDHLEATYLPNANPKVKSALWVKIWEKHNEGMRYTEMETYYAEVAELINLT